MVLTLTVPGKVHSPDKLSRQPLQPDNDSEGEENKDFEDWINNLYSFMHMVSHAVVAPKTEQFLMTLALEKMMAHPYMVPDLQINEPNYNIILQSEAAVKAEMQLEMV